VGALSDDAVWHLSIAYIEPKSRTEMPRKTKIGTEVAHVTRDSDTTFKVKRSKGRFGWLFKSLHNLYGWHHNLRHHPERAATCRSWIFMVQGHWALRVRRVWAGLQCAAYRGGAYCAASHRACWLLVFVQLVYLPRDYSRLHWVLQSRTIGDWHSEIL